jgi:tetratricopeptide (TPR) repeat protein
MSLRRVARLHKGDFTNAERYRKQAELLALHGNQRQMFTTNLVAELNAHALAGDLAGIQEARLAIDAHAARFPGWRGYACQAEGYYELTRGQLEAAREAFERGLAVSRPEPSDPSRCTGAWLRLEAGRIEALVELGRAAEARTAGLEALELCAAHDINLVGFIVRRALALAEAKLGDYGSASARLEGVIDELTAYGIEGLELGATYEARARIAIWAADRDAAERFGRFTAQEYRYGQESPLGARYERLWDEARVAGVAALPELEELKSSMTTQHQRSASWTVDGFRNAEPVTSLARAFERACERLRACSGHLYRSSSSGFTRVASHGEAEADAAFEVMIARCSQSATLDLDDATVIETDVPHVTGEVCDRRGVAYRTTLLTHERGESRAVVGAIVLDASARFPTHAQLSELVELLSGYASQVETAAPA